MIRKLVLPSLLVLASLASPARAGTVYRPGLWQASFSGSANWTADILSASNRERAPGTMMAEITSSTNNPITGTTCSWGDNKTWGYAGQMYMRAGVTYHFYKFVDDNGNYVVDGTTILNNHGTYNAFAHCAYTPETTGWKDVDLRFGNGSGGAGRSGLFGAGWNTNNVTANQTAGWEHIADPGDCTLLRVPTSESFSSADFTNMLINTAGLTLLLSHENLPAGAKLYALMDSVDRGTDLVGDWSAVKEIGPVPSGTGEEYYLVPDAVASGFMRLVLASPGLTGNSFVEWLPPVDLSSVATDGALTFGANFEPHYDYIDALVFVASLGPASSVSIKVELSGTADFSGEGTKTVSLPAATEPWYTGRARFGSLAPNSPFWVRVTATPDVGSPVVKTYETSTDDPRPVFTANVDATHLSPDILLSFTDPGYGSSIRQIRVVLSSTGDFQHYDMSRTFSVNLSTIPTNVDDIVLVGIPRTSPMQYRFIAVNDRNYERNVDLTVETAVGDDNVWSGLSEDVADWQSYVFSGGLPSADHTLFFTSPAGLSPIIDENKTMPSLRFTRASSDSGADTSYLKGYHSCGYDLAGSGVLTFTAEKPIWHGTKGTNVVRNPILFSRNNSQTVYVYAPGGRLDLTGKLMLPNNVSNTTMRVNAEGGEVHFGGPSPDFMGTLHLESSFTLSLDSSFALTNINRIFFGGGWESYTYLKNNTGAPMTFPRCTRIENETGWSCADSCYAGAPFIFPVGTLVWNPRAYEHCTINADLVVQNIVVAKHGSNGSAVLDKAGTGTLAVMNTTSWSSHDCKHYIRLRNGCFWPQTPAGLPPSGDLFAPEGANSNMGTLGLSGDYAPMLDGSATPRVFQGNANTRWGFTAFGGDRTVCWNADPSLNLTNTTSDSVAIRLSNAAAMTSVGTSYTNYYAYPSRLMFGNRSEFADGTVIFRNPIRYELGQNWDTTTYFESSNHVVAARMRGSLKLGNRDKTWSFSGRSFGGYLALEAENADFTGKISVTEKGNLLVNAPLVARSATVQENSGLGGTGSLSTEDGTTVKNGGALFGGEWDKGGVLTLGGKVTFENGSALRTEVAASNDRVGYVKLAPGSVLKLGSPVYVDVATDPRVTPVRGMAIKVLDWSEATFDSGRAPTAADFTARPESNSDIRKQYLFVRDDCLYVTYVSARTPPATLLMLR